MTGSRKGGGVGIQFRRDLKWKRVNEPCKEHLWINGTWQDKKTWLGVAYLWTCIDSREKNKELVDCIRSDINEFSKSGQVIVVADMDSHMDDLDGYTYYNGSLVLDLCDEQNLTVVNRENTCHGQVTWQCGNRQSCSGLADA